MLQISAPFITYSARGVEEKEGNTGGKEGREQEEPEVVPLRKEKVREEQAMSRPISPCLQGCLWATMSLLKKE